MSNEKILLVDDEVKVLFSLSRSLLEEDFGDAITAQSGNEALEIIHKTPSLLVVVSDYHMPGINGIDFLVQVRNLFPDITRILLTGAADLEMAINAVNKGNLFRFLVKPCPSDTFVQAVKDAIRYNQLIVGERELLSKTLNGSIKVMIDILSMQNPSIFAQSNRLRKLAQELSSAMHIEDQAWELELTTLLFQIGAVTIPREIIDKWQAGIFLDKSEREILDSIPRVGYQLIKNIPRMEKIAEGVRCQNYPFVGNSSADTVTGESIPFLARALKILADFDRIQQNTHNLISTTQIMIARDSEYDPHIFGIFRAKVLQLDEQLPRMVSKAKVGEKEIFIEDLRIGMVLTRDVIDRNGLLIVAKTTMITEVLLYKLSNYIHNHAIISPIFIESIF